MSTPAPLLDRRAALVASARHADPDLPRVFDRRLREGLEVTLDGPGGRVAVLEFRRSGGPDPGLCLVMRYPSDHKAHGERISGRRDWRETVIDTRKKEAR